MLRHGCLALSLSAFFAGGALAASPPAEDVLPPVSIPEAETLTEAIPSDETVPSSVPGASGGSEISPACEPVYSGKPAFGYIPRFNGFSNIRSVADPGAPGSAGSGFPHFPFPSHRYSHWYRPKASTLTRCERCAPDSFRPRGLGHLFARPCDGYRMDYTPSELPDGSSLYGPAYSARQPDPKCKDCDHQARHGQE